MNEVLGRTFHAGEDIVREGEEASCMYVIQRGEAEVLKNIEGKQCCIDTLGAGDLFGEMAIVEHTTRSTTVRALTDVQVITINQSTFLRRVQEDPSLAFNIMRVMANRIRHLDEELAMIKQDRGAHGADTGSA